MQVSLGCNSCHRVSSDALSFRICSSSFRNSSSHKVSRRLRHRVGFNSLAFGRLRSTNLQRLVNSSLRRLYCRSSSCQYSTNLQRLVNSSLRGLYCRSSSCQYSISSCINLHPIVGLTLAAWTVTKPCYLSYTNSLLDSIKCLDSGQGDRGDPSTCS